MFMQVSQNTKPVLMAHTDVPHERFAQVGSTVPGEEQDDRTRA
jgi:hypothetical protein